MGEVPDSEVHRQTIANLEVHRRKCLEGTVLGPRTVTKKIVAIDVDIPGAEVDRGVFRNHRLIDTDTDLRIRLFNLKGLMGIVKIIILHPQWIHQLVIKRVLLTLR